MYENDDDESKEKSESDDELGYFSIKEKNPEKEIREEKVLVS